MPINIKVRLLYMEKNRCINSINLIEINLVNSITVLTRQVIFETKAWRIYFVNTIIKLTRLFLNRLMLLTHYSIQIFETSYIPDRIKCWISLSFCIIKDAKSLSKKIWGNLSEIYVSFNILNYYILRYY